MHFLETVNKFVWGIPVLIMILGIGLYLSIRTGFIQFTMFPRAISCFKRMVTGKRDDNNGVSSYQALCTALAATVGTGNLAGVAGAIAIGGPGAIFWMWVCAIVGMATKYAEVTLALRYRILNSTGEYAGGPMYMIQHGMHRRWQWLSVLYCYFGLVASFGVGNATQINTVIGGINGVIQAFSGQTSACTNILFGIIFAALISILLLGGAKRIGRTTEKLIPLASIGYILLAVGVLIVKAQNIPTALLSILKGAFSPQSVTGGLVGSAFTSLRIGASRGVFTNEAGMGTASIAHAGATVKHPAEQGLMGIMEVFIDTIVICTLTALVILCSGVNVNYGIDTGIALTTQAFSEVYGSWVCVPLAVALCLFAIATVLGWGLYGARCAQFIFGEKIWRFVVILQGIMVVVGSVLGTGTVWILSEIVNGLMAIPNLIALAALSPQLSKLTREYKKSLTVGQALQRIKNP